MSDLKVTIGGICLCHFDEAIRNWRIYIPHIESNRPEDPEHRLQIRVIARAAGAPAAEEAFEVPRAARLRIFSDAEEGAAGSREPVLLAETLNLSNFHREPIPLEKEPEKYAAFVTLYGFSLESAPPSDVAPIRFYEVWKKEGDVKTLLEKEIVTQSNIAARIAVADGATCFLTVDGEPHAALAARPGVDYEIVIDNDCHQTHNEPHPQTDFRFYYNIIDLERLGEPATYEIVPVAGKCRLAGCDSAHADDLAVPPELLAFIDG